MGREGNCRCRHGRCTRHPHVARHSYRDADTVEAAQQLPRPPRDGLHRRREGHQQPTAQPQAAESLWLNR